MNRLVAGLALAMLASPTMAAPPEPQAPGRWAEPLPDQERRGWSA